LATDLAPPLAGIVLADTITKLPPEAAGAVIVSSSHGGRYAGALALKARPRGILLNDAGIGREEAGIGSLPLAERHGVAAAALSHMSCRIGEAASMWADGVVSRVNRQAWEAGVRQDMTCQEAAAIMRRCPPPPDFRVPVAGEGRAVLRELDWRRSVLLTDSAASVGPEDAGRIVITGSHGALIGGDPAMALRTDGFAAAFNDAGIGRDGCGITRLPALDRRGIAAVTVSAASARIGEALSTYIDGIISHANQTALAAGARVGEPLQDFAKRLARRAMQ
jgi:hypothetical protein